jgi:peptidoglycan/LPS O-acetylase OafA/YrhL
MFTNAIATASPGLARVRPAFGLAAAAVAAGMLAMVPGRGQTAGTYAIAVPLFAVSSALVLLALVDNQTALISKLVAVSPLRATGKVSYGLYLWHAPMLALLGVAGLPVAVVATLISYRCLELPIRRRRSLIPQIGVGAHAAPEARLLHLEQGRSGRASALRRLTKG